MEAVAWLFEFQDSDPSFAPGFQRGHGEFTQLQLVPTAVKQFSHRIAEGLHEHKEGCLENVAV